MRGKNIIWLSLVAILLMPMVNLTTAQTIAKVYIDPSVVPTDPLAYGHPGDTFDMALKVADVTDLWTIALVIQYKPFGRPLVAGMVLEGDFMKQGGWPTRFVYRIDSFKGQLMIGISRLAQPPLPSVGASGSGTLATFRISVVEAGDSTLEIVNDVLRNTGGSLIPHEAIAGYYHGCTVDLVQKYVGTRGEHLISVEGEVVGKNPFSVLNEELGVEVWTSVTGEAVGVGDPPTKVFTLAHAPHAGTETIYVDGVAQTRDKDYTIDYSTGTVTFAKAPKKGAVITADYKYDGQLTFTTAYGFVVPESETIYVNGVAQTRDVDYTIDYSTGTVTFTHYPPDGAIITADYTYRSVVFQLANPRVWGGSETIYVGGVVQKKDVDYTIEYTSAVITFMVPPSDGALITANYMYSPTKYFNSKAKNFGDLPLKLRVRWDMIRDDGKMFKFYSGQKMYPLAPKPPVYLYVNGYTEFSGWNQWIKTGASPWLNAVGDGNYISDTTNCHMMGRFDFDDIVLGPNDVVAKVSIEGYTFGPYDEGNDFDCVARNPITDLGSVWIGSLYSTGTPSWVGVRWTTPDEMNLLNFWPEMATQQGINQFKLRYVQYYTADGLPRPEAGIDAIRLKVEFAGGLVTVWEISPTYSVVEPFQIVDLPPFKWELSEAAVGKYYVTATVEYSYYGTLWQTGYKVATFTWWFTP